MEKIVELCKRRGFIFQSSEIYGGLQGAYDYGPLGVELKNNLKQAWWRDMVHKRDDMEGLDCSVLTHPMTLKHSQHESTFSDPMVDCKSCKFRMRADFIKNNCCLSCGSIDLTEARQFNLMFKCGYGPLEAENSFVYLRPETAQSIFVNFKNVLDCTSRKLPFGIAQIGKAFRNEITIKNFIFRMREFEQMEIEFFVEKGEDELWHKKWVDERLSWWENQGIKPENLKLYTQESHELAHYAKATVDILYKFPHGFDEIEGVSNRSDFDLASHSKNNESLGVNSIVKRNINSVSQLSIKGSNDNTIIPYVIEPSAGVDRGMLAILLDAFVSEPLSSGAERIVLKLKPHLSPYKVAVVPLARNNEKIVNTSKEVLSMIKATSIGRVKYEGSGNVGKAYRRHDEIGTPICITVDYETFEGDRATVTLRDRDTMAQNRIPISELCQELKNYFA